MPAPSRWACRPGRTRPRRRSRSRRTCWRGSSSEGPTEAELKAAKDNLIGGFPLLIDSNRKLLDNISNIAWNDLPLDYLDTWTAQVQRVTAADIKAAFARKLQPQRMVDRHRGRGRPPLMARKAAPAPQAARLPRRARDRGSARGAHHRRPMEAHQARRCRTSPACGPRPTACAKPCSTGWATT